MATLNFKNVPIVSGAANSPNGNAFPNSAAKSNHKPRDTAAPENNPPLDAKGGTPNPTVQAKKKAVPTLVSLPKFFENASRLGAEPENASPARKHPNRSEEPTTLQDHAKARVSNAMASRSSASLFRELIR